MYAEPSLAHPGVKEDMFVDDEETRRLFEEISKGVREGLSSDLRHALMLRKLQRFKQAIAQIPRSTLDLQLCLVLAIQEKRANFVSYLMQTLSVRLPSPHFDLATCLCDTCKTMKNDRRAFEVFALQIFPAASSPLYVFSQEVDPINYCLIFACSLSRIRREFLKRNLVKAVDCMTRNLSNSINLLLNQLETDEEVHSIMQGDLEQDVLDEYDVLCPKLGRLLAFSRYNLTTPLVHRASQSNLQNLFKSHSDFVIDDIWSLSGFCRALIVGLISYFFIVPASIVFPHPKLVNFVQSPQILASMDNIAIFIYMIIVLAGANNATSSTHEMICEHSINIFLYLQSACLIFIFARILDEVYSLFLFSLRHYIISVYDIAFTVSLALHFAALSILPMWSNEVEFQGVDLSKSLCTGNRTGMHMCELFPNLDPSEAAILQHLIEPSLYINCITGLGHLFLYLSLGNILIWQKSVGVLAITVEKMISDVVKFLAIIGLGWVAYSTAFVNLYSNLKCGTSAFGSTYYTVAIQFFWAMFGMTGPNDYEITDGGKTWDEYFMGLSSVQFTLTLGFLFYASWMILSYTVVVNLLIAMMSSTFQDVQDNKDKTWLYTRSKRIIRFCLTSTRHINALPCPYNLFSPLVALWYKLLKRFLFTQPEKSSQVYSVTSPTTQRYLLLAHCQDEVRIDLKLDISSSSNTQPHYESQSSFLESDVIVG